MRRVTASRRARNSPLAEDRSTATAGLAALAAPLALGLHAGRPADAGDLVLGRLLGAGGLRGSRTRTTTSVGSSGAAPVSSPRRRRRRTTATVAVALLAGLVRAVVVVPGVGLLAGGVRPSRWPCRSLVGVVVRLVGAVRALRSVGVTRTGGGAGHRGGAGDGGCCRRPRCSRRCRPPLPSSSSACSASSTRRSAAPPRRCRRSRPPRRAQQRSRRRGLLALGLLVLGHDGDLVHRRGHDGGGVALEGARVSVAGARPAMGASVGTVGWTASARRSSASVSAAGAARPCAHDDAWGGPAARPAPRRRASSAGASATGAWRPCGCGAAGPVAPRAPAAVSARSSAGATRPGASPRGRYPPPGRAGRRGGRRPVRDRSGLVLVAGSRPPAGGSASRAGSR